MRTPLLVALAALALAGCSPAPDDGAPAAPGGTATEAATPRRTPTARPPRPTPTRTPPPVTVDAPCPYAPAETIAETVGQRIHRTTVTRTKPYVGCGYYRGDGERAVDIAVSALPDARAAQAKAIALGGKTANPVDGVGDGGVARVTDDGAVLAVSRGRALVVVRINQRVSLEAVEIAKLVVAKL